MKYSKAATKSIFLALAFLLASQAYSKEESLEGRDKSSNSSSDRSTNDSSSRDHLDKAEKHDSKAGDYAEKGRVGDAIREHGKEIDEINKALDKK